MKTQSSPVVLRKANTNGFDTVTLMIVTAILGLLGAIAFQNFVNAKEAAAARICFQNMKKMQPGYPNNTNVIGGLYYCQAGGIYTVSNNHVVCSKHPGF